MLMHWTCALSSIAWRKVPNWEKRPKPKSGAHNCMDYFLLQKPIKIQPTFHTSLDFCWCQKLLNDFSVERLHCLSHWQDHSFSTKTQVIRCPIQNGCHLARGLAREGPRQMAERSKMLRDFGSGCFRNHQQLRPLDLWMVGAKNPALLSMKYWFSNDWILISWFLIIPT